jgi:hypothetical protein
MKSNDIQDVHLTRTKKTLAQRIWDKCRRSVSKSLSPELASHRHRLVRPE